MAARMIRFHPTLIIWKLLQKPETGTFVQKLLYLNYGVGNGDVRAEIALPELWGRTKIERRQLRH